jgi:1-acyl-sn-glycerol-3-phosphate acyltransferase
VLYPEGERSGGRHAQEIKKGAAILAAHLSVRFIPCTGRLYDSWPRSKRFPPGQAAREIWRSHLLPKTLSNPEETYKQITEELRGSVTEM